MQINGLWAYLLLEALFIVALLALGLLWLYLREKARARRSPETAGEPPVTDAYRASLEQQIRETEAQLQQLTDDADASTTETIATRLQYLRAEHAADGKGDVFWTRLGDALKPLLNATRPQPETVDESQNRLIQALRTRVQAFETRVANLEQFKVFFFELKQQYEETAQHSRDLHSAVEKSVPDAEQSPELKDALQRMEKENFQLQQQLAQLEQEFDNIMRNVHSASTPGNVAEADAGPGNTPTDKVEQGVLEIKRVIGAQDQQIRELHSIITGLELEINDKQKLQLAMDNISSKNEQLSDVVEILEEENNFMQQQISALLTQGLDETQQNKQRAEEAESKLAAQAKLHAELEKQYSVLEGKLHTAYPGKSGA